MDVCRCSTGSYVSGKLCTLPKQVSWHLLFIISPSVLSLLRPASFSSAPPLSATSVKPLPFQQQLSSPSPFSNICPDPPLSVTSVKPFPFHYMYSSSMQLNLPFQFLPLQFSPFPSSSVKLSPFVQAPCSPALMVASWLINHPASI